MTFDEIVHTRRSIRAYDTARSVPAEHLLSMVEAARWAPSACNSQTWRFTVVTERALLDRICSEAMQPILPNRWLRTAPAIIAGASDRAPIANRVGGAISGIDYYQIDLGIAMEHMVLKAVELGLGTCWIGWFRTRPLKKILGIPHRMKVLALLAVGYPAPQEPSNQKRKTLKEIASWNRWGTPPPDA